MACPQCQHANPPTAKFCSGCGSRLEVACPACAHANAPGSRFCNDCGALLGPAGPSPVASPAEYTPAHLASRILSSRGALEGERKQVTVLFADLKGSMELLADRDPEEARRLLDPVLDRMMEAVHHYEGTVNQVMGDGIMALFGAPLAHEDHGLRACYAALRMQERVGQYGDEMQRSHGVPVQIRVGLNSGDVVVRAIGSDLHMDYTAVGQTTHLAARMEQVAKPGSVLLTGATLRLVEGYVLVKPLGPVAIKGLGAPVEVFELTGAASSRTRLQVAAGRGLTRFVGRDAEVGQLHAAVERVRGSRGQVVALVGEPGAGKSRLVWELTRSHRTEGWLVLESSSVSYGKATPFLAVIDLLRSYFGVESHDGARQVREKVTGRLLTLDESLRPAIADFEALLMDGGASLAAGEGPRRQTLEAVKRLLLGESERQPLLLVLEDLHWLDPDSQALLDSLVESLPSHPVLLLVNYRPEYRHEWGSRSYYDQIRLDPLQPATAETLLVSLLGPDVALAPLRALLVQRAEGNPFFLEQSVRSLLETGVLAGEPGAYRLERPMQGAQVPATVHALLAARIDRLSPEDKNLLQSASVVGKDVPLALLEAIADLPPDEVGRRLTRLQAAELVYEARLFPDVEYTFKHALTHEVAYASLLAERRRGLHARVVDAIERCYPERLGEHRAQLIHHAVRGEVWSKAMAHLRDLGTAASPAEIDQVMGTGPESPGHLWWAGEPERAARAADRDLAVGISFGNAAMRVVASCRLGQAHHTLGNYGRAADVLRQLVASLKGDLVRERFGMAAFPSVWARSWLTWTLAERGEFAEGMAVGEEASRIAEAEDDPYSRAQATFGRGLLYLIQGRAEPAIAVLEEGLVIARLERISFLVPFITGPLGAAYALAGQPDRGISMLEQTAEQADAIRLLANQGLRFMWLGEANRLAGRSEAARGLARRALQLAEERQERGHAAHALCLIGDAAATGDTPDLGGAATACRQALALAEELGMAPLVARCRLTLGEVELRAGEPDRAREHLAAAAAGFEAMGMTGWLVRAQASSAGAG
jgi:class 3 adenylate cyclase/tetratricopeptide (TPR) repeat protein